MGVINKADLLDAARLVEVEAAVARHLRPAVKTLRTSHGAIDVAVLLGLGAAAEDDPDNRWTHHDESGEHDHDDFTSFSVRSEEHTSELQSLMRTSYAVFCLKNTQLMDPNGG